MTLSKKSVNQILSSVSGENLKLRKIYPGDTGERQPVQTVYGGAHLFKKGTIAKIGELSLKSFEQYAKDPETFSKVFGWDADSKLSEAIFEKVKQKLKYEAVEDFRIDFEDGFGNRPDNEEDEVSGVAAVEVASGLKENLLSPYIGIRIKTFSEEMKMRAVRTLDIFLSTLLKETNGRLPGNFVVTLPKVTSSSHVEALVKLFELFEKKFRLKKNSLKMEIMIETTQSIFDTKGNSNLLSLVHASKGRCKAAHFGVYDYTASCDITAKLQGMRHPVCDFARNMMKVCLAGTGVWLSDGATNVMPAGPNKGHVLTAEQEKENTDVVHRAWKLSYDDIQHSLSSGFYQGWDLHPAQLPARYAAVFHFFLSGLGEASDRLKNFVEKSAQATLVGDVFDDAATGQGLLNYFLRALNCGAISNDEITRTGLTLEEVRGKSFLKILHNRKKV